VLKSGGTAPTDFTLHDEGHAFRVAERMAQIMPAETIEGLSSYELAFLLFSAYLHDIGMTPKRRKVSLHYNYLLTGVLGDLNEAEGEKFQEWLDDEQDGLVPPLCNGTPTPEQLTPCFRLF